MKKIIIGLVLVFLWFFGYSFATYEDCWNIWDNWCYNITSSNIWYYADMYYNPSWWYFTPGIWSSWSNSSSAVFTWQLNYNSSELNWFVPDFLKNWSRLQINWSSNWRFLSLHHWNTTNVFDARNLWRFIDSVNWDSTYWWLVSQDVLNSYEQYYSGSIIYTTFTNPHIEDVSFWGMIFYHNIPSNLWVYWQYINLNVKINWFRHFTPLYSFTMQWSSPTSSISSRTPPVSRSDYNNHYFDTSNSYIKKWDSSLYKNNQIQFTTEDQSFADLEFYNVWNSVAIDVLNYSWAVNQFTMTMTWRKLQYRSDTDKYSLYNSSIDTRVEMDVMYNRFTSLINTNNEMFLTLTMSTSLDWNTYCVWDTCLYAQWYYNLDNKNYLADEFMTGDVYVWNFDKITNLVSQENINMYNLVFENQFKIYDHSYSWNKNANWASRDYTVIDYWYWKWNNTVINAEFGFAWEDFAQLYKDNLWNYYLSMIDWGVYKISDLYKKLGIETYEDIYWRTVLKYTLKIYTSSSDINPLYEKSFDYTLWSLKSCQQVSDHTVLWTGSVYWTWWVYLNYSIYYLNPEQVITYHSPYSWNSEYTDWEYITNYGISLSYLTWIYVWKTFSYLLNSDSYNPVVCQDNNWIYITHSKYLTWFYFNEITPKANYYSWDCLKQFTFHLYKNSWFASWFDFDSFSWWEWGTVDSCKYVVSYSWWVLQDIEDYDTWSKEHWWKDIWEDWDISFFNCPEKYKQYKWKFQLNPKNFFSSFAWFLDLSFMDFDLIWPISCSRWAVIYWQRYMSSSWFIKIISIDKSNSILKIPYDESWYNFVVFIWNLILFIPGILILWFLFTS